MRLNFEKVPKSRLKNDPQVGDVFAAGPGGRTETVAWIVVAVRGRVLHMLGMDIHGEIVSTTTNQIRHMEDRTLIGRCPAIAALVLPVNFLLYD